MTNTKIPLSITPKYTHIQSQKEKRMRGVKKIFEEVIAKNIPNLMKTRRKYDGIYKVVKDKSSEPRINIQQNYPSK